MVGVAVVHISHRLKEGSQVADRVSVVHDLKHISTRLVRNTNSQKMIAEMVRHEVGHYLTKMESTAQDEVLLRVEG